MSEDVVQKLEAKIDKVLSILLGNGEIGLCERVRDNTEKLDEVREWRKDKDRDEKEKPDKIGKWVVRAFGAALAFGELLIAYKMLMKD